VQDQPVMRVQLEFGGHVVLDGAFDLHDVAARRDAGAVADAEDVGVDGLRGVAEPHVEDHVRGLAPDARQRLERRAGGRHLAAVLLDQDAGELQDVLRLVAEEADRLDVLDQPSSPSASIFSGVSATAKSARVALFTPASVACADSATATRSVKALTCSSSPFGSGLAAWKRAKISCIVW
jgi:hypothetical protein